jgi:hypothetical protein
MKASLVTIMLFCTSIVGGCYDKGPPFPIAALWSGDGSLWLGGQGTHFDPDPPLEGAYDPPGDIWIARVGPSGNEILWQIELDADERPESTVDMAETADGSIAVLARTGDHGLPTAAILLVSRDGVILWKKKLTTGGMGEPVSIAVGEDGGIYVLGGLIGVSAILALDLDGQARWALRQPGIDGGTHYLVPHKIHPAPGGGVVVTARLQPEREAENPVQDIVVLRLSADGDVMWQKQIDSGSYESLAYTGSLSAGSAMGAGGRLVLGGRATDAAGEGDQWIAAMDMDGALVWQVLVDAGPGRHPWMVLAGEDGKAALLSSTMTSIYTHAAWFFDDAGGVISAWSFAFEKPIGVSGGRYRQGVVDILGWQLAGTIDGYSLSEDGTGAGCLPDHDGLDPVVTAWTAAAADSDIEWTDFMPALTNLDARTYRRSGGQTFNLCWRF